MRSHRLRRLLGRAGSAVAGAGVALAGLVVAAAPASAAACSGTSGVTVVVDNGSSISTRCAPGDPSSAMKALTGAGFSVTTPQMYPGSVVCRINGFPESDPCVRMPPADAYWAFFHAKRGGSWVYSSTGVTSHDPAPGTVVGFRFGAGQQPRIAPPEPTATSEPDPTKATTAPKQTTSAPRSTAPAATSASGSTGTKSSPTGSRTASSTPSATRSPTPSAGATASASASPSTGGPAPTTVAAAPTSQPEDGSSGLGTLLAGAALVALVAAGAGWAAWKRRV